MSSRNEKNVSCGVDDFFTKLIFAKLSVILQEYSNVRTIDFDCSLKAAQTDRMIDRGRTYPPTRSQLVGSLAPLQLFMTVKKNWPVSERPDNSRDDRGKQNLPTRSKRQARRG